MRTIRLGNTKEQIPVLGMGTYGIYPGQPSEEYNRWKEALRTGIELGMTHIDTAELYGEGKSEEIIGEVIQEYDRDELFITSKILPSHSSRKEMQKAAEGSLERLGIDYFDLYLIHWLEEDSSIPKIMAFLESLIKGGKTRFIGVSNFDVDECRVAMKTLEENEIVTNQVEINLQTQSVLKKDAGFYKKTILL